VRGVFRGNRILESVFEGIEVDKFELREVEIRDPTQR
jgi:hypothetical protein